MDDKFWRKISRGIQEVFSNSPAKDFEKNLRASLQSFFSRLDLVTREEFDVQQAVLIRTREKLTRLETRLAELEASLQAREKAKAGQ